MANFEIIPSIDIRGGKVVRLLQGDYAKETVYNDDPAATARDWYDQGARRLHVVDLDGAKAGHPVNMESISQIVKAVGDDMIIGVGGGIRDGQVVEELVDLGVARVVLGTIAVVAPSLATALAITWENRVIVGLDARDGKVAIEGWTEQTTQDANTLAHTLAKAGVRRFIYTDIARDGMLSAPNIEALRSFIAAAAPALVFASGGIASLDHVRQVKEAGAAGAIIGKALYTGDISLTDALQYRER